MRRRNRKHRKSIHQESQPRTIVTKAGNADDLSCNRNLRHFSAKSEPISSSQFNLIVKNKKTPKNNAKIKERSNGKHSKEPNWLENNLFVSFPSSKMSSVAYFIPLKDYYCDISVNDLSNFMDWNQFVYYGSNSSSMISHYNNKRKNSKQDKSMVLEFPQLRKSRSSSESSINSDDSFICFEFTEEYDTDDEVSVAVYTYICSFKNSYYNSNVLFIFRSATPKISLIKITPAILQTFLQTLQKLHPHPRKENEYVIRVTYTF